MASRWLSTIGRHPTLLAIYVVFALQAFLFQAFIRLHQCAGIDACALSLAKGVAWSVIWPAYWLGYFLLF
jgi:hypothetical protein